MAKRKSTEEQFTFASFKKYLEDQFYSLGYHSDTPPSVIYRSIEYISIRKDIYADLYRDFKYFSVHYSRNSFTVHKLASKMGDMHVVLIAEGTSELYVPIEEHEYGTPVMYKVSNNLIDKLDEDDDVIDSTKIGKAFKYIRDHPTLYTKEVVSSAKDLKICKRVVDMFRDGSVYTGVTSGAGAGKIATINLYREVDKLVNPFKTK